MQAHIEAIDKRAADHDRDHQQRRGDRQIGKTRNMRPLRTKRLRQGTVRNLSGHAVNLVERTSGRHGSPALILDSCELLVLLLEFADLAAQLRDELIG